MILVFSLIEVLVISLCFANLIKKRPVPFYILSLLLALLVVLRSAIGVGNNLPPVLIMFGIVTVYRGGISCALFAIIMWLGVLPKSNKLVSRLYQIRGELSIMACIFALSHNIAYGFFENQWFIKLFTAPTTMELPEVLATIVSLLLIAIMLPLFITSFPSVRKKMAPQKWKQLQRWAYLFYVLLYVHVMIIFVPQVLSPEQGGSGLQNVVIYSIVFIPYFLLLIKKLTKVEKQPILV